MKIGEEANAKIVKTNPGNIRDELRQEKLPEWWKDHVEFVNAHDLVDFESASSVSGHKFCYLKREVALLEIALIQWAFHHVYHFSPTVFPTTAYVPISTPDLVGSQFIYACGFNVSHFLIYELFPILKFLLPFFHQF